MIAFDSTVLLTLLYPDVRSTTDKAKKRLEYLVSEISKQRSKVIIPTPVLSEVLVHAGDAMTDYLNILHREACFRIADFDERAAIEVALMTAQDGFHKKKKELDRTETIAKVKYDRQIAAIAKVENVSALYTDDEGLKKTAQRLGVKVITTAELPLPPEDAQFSLQLDASDK